MHILMNTGWWADALRQRRALDLAAHDEGREHQSADTHAMYAPDAPREASPESLLGPIEGGSPERALGKRHGDPDYELTAWEREWITQRVNDAHVLHLTQRNEARAVLAEAEHEYLTRELDARARDYFGATHDETRAACVALRGRHQKAHDEAHKIWRKTEAGGLEPLPAEAVAEIRAAHVQTIRQIEDHIAPKTGLIDRHISTVKAEVAEARSQAQRKVDDCDRLLSVSYEEHVARELERVRDELRSGSK